MLHQIKERGFLVYQQYQIYIFSYYTQSYILNWIRYPTGVLIKLIELIKIIQTFVCTKDVRLICFYPYEMVWVSVMFIQTIFTFKSVKKKTQTDNSPNRNVTKYNS